VKSVGVLESEHPDDLVPTDLDRVRLPAVVRNGQVGHLAQQRSSRLGRDLCSGGAARGGHRGDDQAFDEGRGRQGHPVADGGVRKQVEGELGAEQRAAEIHEDHDTVRAVRPLDRFHDADGIRPEGRVVKSRRHLDRHRASVQHLSRQRDGSVCERTTVGDHDETNPGLGVGRRALRHVHFAPPS
jgi:hypothetical protein